MMMSSGVDVLCGAQQSLLYGVVFVAIFTWTRNVNELWGVRNGYSKKESCRTQEK